MTSKLTWRAAQRRYVTLVTGACLLTALLVACARPGVRVASVSERYDRSVTQAVERMLARDPSVLLTTVSVSSDRGVVTLRGEVGNLLQRRRAQELVETVRGVRSVINLLQVEPVPASDDASLSRAVHEALEFHPATSGEHVYAAVNDGHAILRGQVDSMAEAALAQRVAEEVEGLRSVANELTLDRDALRSDREIRAEIEARLAYDPWVDAGLLKVQVEDGRVVLEGTVGRVYGRRRAAAAAWVRGVKDVDIARLDVESWAGEPERRVDATPRVPTAEIVRAIELAFDQDPRVPSDALNVRVSDGSVLLTGTVLSLAAKRAAEQDAAATLGVGRVENRIIVVPPPAVEDHAEDQLRRAIQRHPLLDEERISVRIEQGTAHLSGHVESEHARRTADDLAAQAIGVSAVWNELTVQPGSEPPAPREPGRETGGLAYPPATRQDIPEQGMHVPNARAVALAWCQQQQRCGFIGSQTKHASVDACTEALMSNQRDQLQAFACRAGVYSDKLELCLVEVRNTDCALPVLTGLADCRPEQICREAF
jgi:osmotically-inducible protein OsmY